MYGIVGLIFSYLPALSLPSFIVYSIYLPDISDKGNLFIHPLASWAEIPSRQQHQVYLRYRAAEQKLCQTPFASGEDGTFWTPSFLCLLIHNSIFLPTVQKKKGAKHIKCCQPAFSFLTSFIRAWRQTDRQPLDIGCNCHTCLQKELH